MIKKRGLAQVRLEKAINFVQLKGVVIFVSAVVYNETQENSAALSHIQLYIPL